MDWSLARESIGSVMVGNSSANESLEDVLVTSKYALDSNFVYWLYVKNNAMIAGSIEHIASVRYQRKIWRMIGRKSISSS